MVYPQLGFPQDYGSALSGGITAFVPDYLESYNIRKTFCSEEGAVYSPGPDGFTKPSQSAISQRSWGFHNVWGGIDPGEHRFHLRFDGVVDIRKDFPIRGCRLTFSGWHCFYELQVGVYTPCEVVHTVRAGVKPTITGSENRKQHRFSPLWC